MAPPADRTDPAALGVVIEASAASGVADLSNRGLRELPGLLRGTAGMANTWHIREVNLAFNSLASLAGLVEACPQLERLGASHNRLRTLPHLGSLAKLCRADLSSNSLADVSPLAGCPMLGELWLTSNQLQLSALLPLASLPALRDLVLLGNPCHKISPTGLCRHAVVLLLPSLNSLDAQPIGPAVRTEALTFLSSSGSRATLQAQLGSKQALSLLRGKGVTAPPRQVVGPPSQLGGGQGQRLIPGGSTVADSWGGGSTWEGGCGGSGGYGESGYGESGCGGSGSGVSSPGGNTTCGGSVCGGSPGSTFGFGSSSGRPWDGGGRGRGRGRGPSAASGSRGSPGSDGRGGGSMRDLSACFEDEDGGASEGFGACHAGSSASSAPDLSSCGGRSSSSRYGQPPRRRRGGGAGTGGAAGGGSAGLAELQAEASARMDDAQLKLQESERLLAAALSGSPPKQEGGKGRAAEARYGRRSGGSQRRKTGAENDGNTNDSAPPGGSGSTSAQHTVPSADTEFYLSYPRGGAPALTVRADGSAVMRWPGGGLAVSVDASPDGFTLAANYRRGGRIAATIDGSGGGFAYRQDGSMVLRLDGARGGAIFDRSGKTIDAWEGRVRTGPRLCIPLDEFLALVLEPNTEAPNTGLSAVFKCDGIAHELAHGHNPQRGCWRACLDAEPALASLGTSRVARRPRANTSSALGLGGQHAPRAGLGAIADAISLLPDLSAPSRTR